MSKVFLPLHYLREHYVVNLADIPLQGGLEKKLDSDLEALVVAPVAAAVNSLRRDTVFWQRGLLSSPPVRSLQIYSRCHP